MQAVDLISVRAATNAVGIAMANFGSRPHAIVKPKSSGAGAYYCGGDDCNGHSMGADHRGQVLALAAGDPGLNPVNVSNSTHRPGAEGSTVVAFDIAALRAYRKTPRGAALVAPRLQPQLCRIPVASEYVESGCNDHRMWP